MLHHHLRAASRWPAASRRRLGAPSFLSDLAHCAAAFGWASSLTKHVRTVHEKRRDHACTQCAAAFGTASDLTKHVRTVHEKRKDHACTQCAAAFGQKGDLTRHVRTQHPGSDSSQPSVAALADV